MFRFVSKLSRIFSPEVFLWVYPLLLIVPNIILDITEYSSPLVKVANIILPFGAYLFVLSLWRNVGRTSLFFIPILVFTCVQLVLLHLYGESIIAVDMMLNLVTTNMSEASELLGNLTLAIILVGLIYIPLLCWGLILAIKSAVCEISFLRKSRYIGEIIFCGGLLCLVLSYGCVKNFHITRDIYPVNVITNSVIATQRTIHTRGYYETSADFSYNAKGCRAQEQREIYVLVIGETSRAENWELFGYQRHTNPRLTVRDNLLRYPKTLSESNTTHKSVPLMLTWLTADNFGDSIYYTKSIIDAFNEAGYRTAFLSNQGRNHSFVDFFAREAQITLYLPDDGKRHFDNELLPELKKVIETSSNNKLFIIIHTYGSHYNYRERYKPEEAVFLPDEKTQPVVENRSQMINAYDNTIVGTDALLDEIINVLEQENCVSSMIYLSDHGEDILDDERERYLHASPVPTYYQLHIPLIIWMSKAFTNEYPTLFDFASKHQGLDISSSEVLFHTLLGLSDIQTTYRDDTKSLVSGDFKVAPRKYLSDLNEGLPLDEAGLRMQDFEQLESKKIRVD